jgi:hypothetical protein
MSNIIDIRNNLTNTIVNEYANQSKINSHNNVNFTQNILQAVIVNCGEKCGDCQNLYMKDSFGNYIIDKTKDPVNYYNLLKRIGVGLEGETSGPCYSLCHCTIGKDVILNNSVFLNKTSDLAIQESDYSKVTENIIKQMKESNPDAEYSTLDITTIVKNITTNLKQDNTINIDQTVNSAQILEVQGFGNVKAISMNSSINIIMKALVSNESNIKSLTNITNQSITKVVNVVNAGFKEGLSKAFNYNKKFLIVLGIGLACMVLFLIFSFFWSAFNHSK